MPVPSRIRPPFQFKLLHILIAGFAAALLFGLPRLGPLAVLGGILVVPLYILAISTMASIRREQEPANKVILLVSSAIVLFLTLLVIVGFQILLFVG